MADIMAATGWQSLSAVRGFISGSLTTKMGLKIEVSSARTANAATNWANSQARPTPPPTSNGSAAFFDHSAGCDRQSLSKTVNLLLQGLWAIILALSFLRPSSPSCSGSPSWGREGSPRL
jgi:hypothetical protein